MKPPLQDNAAPEGVFPSRKPRLADWMEKAYRFLTTPWSIVMLTYSVRVHPAYGLNWFARIRMGVRFWYNNLRVESGTSWRAHVVMAMRLLELPPTRSGCIVECGCYKGGASVNLSIMARLTGRTLHLYDSFEGLPPPVEGDYVAEETFKDGFVPGIFSGSLQEVESNIRRFGELGVCEFHKGWFEDTLPQHRASIDLAFVDVDFCSSLHTCLVHLWPKMRGRSLLFMDEYRAMSYCSVFFSEKYWERYFDSPPPGLIGIGTGVQVGMHYVNPRLGIRVANRIQAPSSVAYAVKGDTALWDYFPEEALDEREGGLP